MTTLVVLAWILIVTAAFLVPICWHVGETVAAILNHCLEVRYKTYRVGVDY